MSEQPVHLGDLSDLGDGQMRAFHDVGEFGVVVCRVGGQLFALDDNCSHREAKLSEGRLRGGLLVCPLHGAQFDVASGAPQGPPAITPVVCHRIVEEADGSALYVAS
jgi:3-phenylpropionate/trans-cinnamate dioxygenase ferredoxin component